MRPTTRMMLANRGREPGRGGNMQNRDGGTENRGRANIGYARNGGDWEPEGGYEPQDNYGDGPSNRFRDRRGREHYNNGRFSPMRNGVEVEGDVVFNRVPPIYTPESNYRYEDGNRMIGFGGNYSAQMTAPRDELAERRRQLGHAGHTDHAMDRQTAAAWVRQMHNSDGSTGEHWTYEQAAQLLKQKGIDCDPAEFYAAINMLWSDYGTVARRIGQDNNDFWADMTKAFLMDKDAKPNKLALYYECVVK